VYRTSLWNTPAHTVYRTSLWNTPAHTVYSSSHSATAA
jgi:hypothetical protein